VPVVARAVIVLATLLATAGADASAAMRVVDVPGVSGRAVSIVAAARLADGGAIVAGTLTPLSPRRARPRIVVVRLRHDGLIDTSFGSSGVVTTQLVRGDGRAGSRATAVAADPASGRSWIGVAVGGNPAGAVLALDGRGRRVRRFGERGVVRFDGDATAPTAVAYGNGRLAVAATRRPCSGCQVLVIDPVSGARRGQLALAPVPDANAGRCSGARVSSLALAGPNRLVLGGSGGASCPTRIVVRDGALRPVADQAPRAAAADPAPPATARAEPAPTPPATARAEPAPTPPATADDAPVRTAVAAAGAPLDLCAGVERDGAVGLVRVAVSPGGPPPPALPAPGWKAVSGELAAVVPLGDRACGALLRRAGKPALVVQAANGDDKPSVVEAPADLRAGAIYRCKRHVLVVGTRRRGGVARASVAVTAIARR
jgi:hypothetical protein